MEEEIWKDIRGAEGIYQVSDQGRVRSLDRIIPYRNGRDRPIRGRVMSPVKGGSSCEYLYVKLSSCPIRRESIHRLVASTFINNPERKPCVDHIDANPENNKVSNLRWCTQKENVHFSAKNGRRFFRGENSPRALLSQGQVSLIRETVQYNRKYFTNIWLGKCFKVNPSTISKIVQGKNWNGNRLQENKNSSRSS